MICLHRLNPMPELDVLVVKKGTKILSRTSGKIPSPLSDIVNVGLPLEKNFISMFLSVLRSHVSRAFFNKLISTCSICARSAYKYTQLYTLMYQSQNVKVLITITCLRYKVTKSFVYLLATNI